MSKDVEDRVMSRRPVTEAIAASDRGAESERTKLTSSMSGVRKKVRIRIKMPERSCCESHEQQQLEDDRMRNERDQAVAEVVAEEERHVCVLCGKGFRSGKALGGHMRVHSQRDRKDKLEIAGVERAAASAAAAAGGSSEMDDEHDELKMRSRGKPMCPICEKDFPSNKALFGHMRCHPERNWRGIQPPVVYSSPSTVSDVQAQSDDDVSDCGDDDGLKELKIKNSIVDLAKELEDFGWGAKAMRGREAAVKSCTSSRPTGCPVGFRNLVVEESSLPPDQADAGVQNLLFLSRGGVDDIKSVFSDYLADQSCGSYKEEKKRRCSQVLTAEEIISGLTNSAKKKLKVDNYNKVAAGAHDLMEFDPSSPQLDARPPIVSGANSAYGNTIKGALAGVYNAAELIMLEDKKVHKVRKYLMVNDLTANHPHSSPVNKPATALHHEINLKVQESEGYKCTTCNKSFTSHQALGGHKSSHNKLRNGSGFKNFHPHNQENVIPQGYDNSVEHGGASLNYGVKMGAIPTSAHPLLHQCNVCFKIYPTGQALGGHKRLHCSSAISKAQLHLPIMVIPEPQAAHPPPPAAPLPAGQASDNAREVCKFDLNELPSVEEDGHEDDQDAIVQPVYSIAVQQTLQEAGEDVPASHSAPPASGSL